MRILLRIQAPNRCTNMKFLFSKDLLSPLKDGQGSYAYNISKVYRKLKGNNMVKT